MGATGRLREGVLVLSGNGNGTFTDSTFVAVPVVRLDGLFSSPSVPTAVPARATGDPDRGPSAAGDTLVVAGKSTDRDRRKGRGSGLILLTDVMTASPVLTPVSLAGTNALGYAVGAAAGDFNRDGRPDLITATNPRVRRINAASGTNLARLVGDGGTPFSPGAPISAPAGTVAVAVVDLNNDGNLDLVVGDRARHAVTVDGIRVLIGNSDGTFQSSMPITGG